MGLGVALCFLGGAEKNYGLRGRIQVKGSGVDERDFSVSDPGDPIPVPRMLDPMLDPPSDCDL